MDIVTLVIITLALGAYFFGIYFFGGELANFVTRSIGAAVLWLLTAGTRRSRGYEDSDTEAGVGCVTIIVAVVVAVLITRFRE